MITRYLFLLIPLCLYQAVFAQQADTLPNSGDIVEQGARLREQGQYKAAETLYRQVSPSDTNYNQILRGLAWASIDDSDYEAALRFVDTGLNRFPDDAGKWYVIRGMALRRLNQSDLALAAYGQAIQKAPGDVNILLDRGLMYFKLGRYDEAKADFERCALMDALLSNTHYYLGLVSLQQGDLVPAMFSLLTYMLMSPDGDHVQAVTQLLLAIANVTDQVSALAAKHQAGTENMFDAETEILMSKAALDPKYPMQSEEDGPIIRQFQALLEKTTYRPEDKGFFMQYYVPYFRNMYTMGMFNTVVHHVLSGLGIKSVDEWNKRHKKEIQLFADTSRVYFARITATETLLLSARDTAMGHYIYEGGGLHAKGSFVGSTDKPIILAGPWEFYYSNGQLQAKGNLDANQDRDGEWVSYHANGSLLEIEHYIHGKENDTDNRWFDNGVLEQRKIYEQGTLTGKRQIWYYNGVPKEITEYLPSGARGREIVYTSNGLLKSSGWQKDGEFDGADTDYYYNGRPSWIEHYVEGRLEGSRNNYSNTGVLLKESDYLGGKENGDWKTYFPSGHIQETYHYDKGNLEGPDTEYYENGRMKETYAYTKGKEDGKEFDYTEGGKLYEVDTRDRGRIRAVQYFDSAGKPSLSSAVSSSGGSVTYYDSLGYKTGDGIYVYKGDKTTAYRKYYFATGQVSGMAIYRNENLEGPRVNFFRDGRVSDSTNYVNDQQDGYYAYYYETGQLRQDGWYAAGDRTGPYREFDIFGNLTSTTYYNDGSENGYSDSYAPNGRKNSEFLYKSGWPVHYAEWDTSGRLIQDKDITPGAVDLNNQYGTVHYNHYQTDGAYIGCFFDHSVSVKEFFRHGLLDSTYLRFYYGGQKASEGTYAFGNRTGDWKEYFENGKLRLSATYQDGDLEGKRSVYNEDGNLFREDSYVDDILEGPTVYYEDAGQVSYILYYHNGYLIGYGYLGRDRKPVPVIPLRAGAGKVTAFFANGQKSATFTVVDGNIDGQRTTWYSNGTVDYQGLNTMGKEQGLVVRHYPNGHLMSEEMNYYDNLHGRCKYYYPSGVLKEALNFYNGDMEGPSTYYDESGQLKKTKVYYYGVLQSVY